MDEQQKVTTPIT